MLPLIQLRRLQREGLRDGKVYRQLLEELLQGDLEEVQSSLLEEVFHDKLLKQFRPLPTARKIFAKSVLMALEELEEANDELFELCTKEVLLPVDDSGLVGHKIFELQEGYVVVRVADQIGGGLETGCMIWTGGCMLLGLALAGALDHLLHGHILELGAGTGFLGLALGLQGRPVTLSDNQLQVLENLRYNLDATRQCNDVELTVDVCRLDWCEPDNVPKADVLIGSDLAYDVDAMPSLAGVLAALLSPRGTARHAILACMKRQEGTFEALKEAMTSHGLTWRDLSIEEDHWKMAWQWAQQGCDVHSGAQLILLQVMAEVSESVPRSDFLE